MRKLDKNSLPLIRLLANRDFLIQDIHGVMFHTVESEKDRVFATYFEFKQ